MSMEFEPRAAVDEGWSVKRNPRSNVGSNIAQFMFDPFFVIFYRPA